MTESTRAVFLSYASQDVEASQRICEALRAAGIEVWFDQSELCGGDAWDQQIRRQIKTCGLFIPVISTNTHEREEGYFRLEWKLAVDRSHLMAGTKAFLLPVVIDNTRDDDERTPEKFREVQWTRLPDGVTPTAFAERVSRLLAHDPRASLGPARALPSATGPSRSRSVLLLIATVAALGTGYFAVERLVLSRRVAAPVAAAAAPASPAPSAIPEKSIAVLPFVDMSEKKDQEYFSDGLSEELIDLLAKVPDLRVPARTSSFYFKGKLDDIATIAQKLRVTHVLEGSVRKAGNTIRVTAQLIRADNGYHLWSETYDRDLKDIFKVQDQIAAAVVEALKARLAPTARAPSHRTSNTEAYNQFLLGRQFWNRRNPDGFRRSAEAYRKAIELDPNYAAAYAGLAMSESSAADMVGDPAGLRQAEAAAEKAVTLAPNEADGYTARGFLRFTFSWDWAGAQADYAKARALDPANSEIYRWSATLLASLGRFTEAIAAGKRALDLDPLSSSAWDNVGRLRMVTRDFAGARAAFRRALEINPESVAGVAYLGLVQLLDGQSAEALATFRKVDFEVFRLTGIAMAEHTLGHATESRQALDEAIAKDAQNGAYQIAGAFAWRGEKQQAFEWLERAYRQRDGGLSQIKYDPWLENLRADPRYKALLRKLKLPE